MDNLKAEQIGSAKWRVLAIPFGGPLKDGRDLDHEYFSPRTDIKADWFDRRPVLFHHGQDETAKDTTLGTEDDLTKEDDGWWGTMWLDRQSRYFAFLDKLMRSGKAFGSSGAISHLVRKEGPEITVWPHAEQTITPTPANIFSRVTASKAVDDFTSVGIQLDPAIRGLLTELDTLTNDLESDLPLGGGDPAVSRLSATLDQLDALIRVP